MENSRRRQHPTALVTDGGEFDALRDQLFRWPSPHYNISDVATSRAMADPDMMRAYACPASR